jgi:hypothetical protein
LNAVLGTAERREMPTPKVVVWMGRRIDELDKNELLEVVNYCAAEIEAIRADRDRWREAGDAAKYLMNGPNAEVSRDD